MPSSTLPSQQDLCHQLEQTLLKLEQDPSRITTEDARRFSENYDAHDTRSARIISAVEACAVANLEVHDQNPSFGQELHTSLLTLVKDLQAAVTCNPGDVTDEVLRTAQSVVSKMQKAVGNTNVAHPEVEAELQQEIIKVERKIEQGTITKAEADHLHSLESRAYGHTEKGGITAIAQSVVAKRERQLSLGTGSSPAGGRKRADSQTQPGPSQEKSIRGEASDAPKNGLYVLGDWTNGFRQTSCGTGIETKIAELGLGSKGNEKNENVGKKDSEGEDRHDSRDNEEGPVAPIVAKPPTRKESQHVFGP
ncbi:hypothetical protein IAQ61_004244 [Plenodomus lingam]|uniref:uncharacterized protein n=1 Tax=Leptosphaeria maculans TaxID=5022 RepID=UPI0033182024|nr:hypothetical protein IAQ61_004244 [Plenodomus lingam]